MLDIKLLREDIHGVAKSLAPRGYVLDIEAFQKLDASRKSLQVDIQQLQSERNTSAKEIGIAKAKGLDVEHMLQAVATIGDGIKNKEAELAAIQEALNDMLMTIPNIPHSSVPYGKTEEDNVEIRKWGTPTQFDFIPKQHDELGEQLAGIDIEMAAKLSGSRFYVLKGKIAQLHRALGQFMLDLHTREHGYQEISVPYLVKSEALYGTGQFPKFKEDQFGVQDDLWLIPTAEVPVTNLVREQILEANILPLKFTCHSACFRREAGSAGKDTRGIIRRHQFEKVELVQIVCAEDSYNALEELTSHAEKVLQLLELPYRVVALCTGDIGFSAAKTYDIEVWLPGQNSYREISSCSNTEAFQARRMQARVRSATDNKKIEPVHTLNGSGIAIGRALVAVMENYQDAKGRIRVPKVLQNYMGGVEWIGF